MSKDTKAILITAAALAAIGITFYLYLKMILSKLTKAKTDSNVQAFLQVIRTAEGTAGPNGYNTLFGGKTFSDLSTHPNVCVPYKNTCSTAAGAYQILYRTWRSACIRLGVSDFSKETQDLIAMYLINEQGALEDVIAGRFATAIDKVQNIWASLPDVPGGEKAAGYGQPQKSLASLTAAYKAAGGRIAA